MTSPGRSPPSASGLQAALIRFAIRFRGVVVALAIVLLGYGVLTVMRAKYDVFPEFAPPQVSIQTEAPGLSPEQIEALVTQPIENAINGVPGVQALRSSSIQGLSVVTVIFDPASDVYRDRQLVAERLAIAAQQLPVGTKPPAMTPLTSSTSTILVLGLTSDKRSLMDLRTIADWTLRPRLLAVPGITKVSVYGGDTRSIQVAVHPDELIRYHLGFNEVLGAARKATGIRGAGFIDTANQRIVFQSEGQSLKADDIARTVLVSEGALSLRLGNVADVVDAPEPPIGGAAIMSQPGVILVVSAQYGANTLEVTGLVEDTLADLRQGLETDGVALHADLLRPADFIETATNNVRDSLFLGGIMVVIVLFLFLFDLRTAAICCTAIPLSLLTAVIVLTAFGVTLNAMTLGGLAIAVGEVVDDAVIDVENIVRRLRQNRQDPSPRSTARVVLDASLEVRGAVVYASFAVILVFLPVIALPGIAGRLFAPLGFAYILAILASLLVALTVTPALCMVLLAKKVREGNGAVVHEDPPVVNWTRGEYKHLLRGIVARPKSAIAVAALVTLAGGALVPFFGAAFLPELKEGHFTLHMSAVAGTSIAESQRLGGLVTGALSELPMVRSVAQRIGRAEKAEDTWGTHYSEFEVALKAGLSGDEIEQAQAELRRALIQFPGVSFVLKPFLTERIEEILSGYTASVVVNIFGNDLDLLDVVARDVARVIGGIHSAKEVQLQSPPGMPQLTIRLRKQDLERWGFDVIDVLDVIRAAYQGDIVGQTFEGNRVFNVIVTLDSQHRNDITKVGNLSLRTPGGTYILLRQIADIYQSAGRYQVAHLGAQRVQTVTANVAGRDVAAFVHDAKAILAGSVELPSGVYIEFAGSAEAQAQSRRDLFILSCIAGVAIVLLLSIVTRNWRNLVLVLVNMPFALVGGVLAVFASGGQLTLGAMVGFVTLFGITLRNSIMMISHYEHLVEIEGWRWGAEAAIEGAGDRLAPILMTSLVTALGLLPLAIGMDDPGREVEGPMALVILGGLLSSMALNLLVLPPLALRFGRFEPAEDEFDHPAPEATTRHPIATG